MIRRFVRKFDLVQGAFAVGLMTILAPASFAASEAKAPAHVSSKVCAACHQKEYAAWRTSHHSWALRPATAKNVLGDFDDIAFEHNGIRSRFFQRDGKFLVDTDGPDGKLTEYAIEYTVGVEPLQQYLVALDKGRLQALDIAWDTQAGRWFHLYPDQKNKGGDGLHWSGPYKNWQARCAECHQTNFIKGYAPKSSIYQSSWSELTVGCEACHGPGQDHVNWARDTDQNAMGMADKGLTVKIAGAAAEREVQVCARCHSRRGPLGANSPPPGAKFSDHYKLALLREGLYHADGQINDEVYVYGSFLQSKMYRRGVRCSNCHEPHDGTLVAEGNGICTQCHGPAGNEAFGSLKKAAYDSPLHHHHEPGSEGAKCVNCHMPAKTYMQVDPRRDHSFRVPRPDLSASLTTPNACGNCHGERATSWAAAHVKKWFPNGRSGAFHYGQTLHAGRTEAGPKTAEKLVDLATNTESPAIVRASALDLLRRAMKPDLIGRIAPLLNAEDALIRAAALRLLDHAPPTLRVELAAPLLRDPAKAVRLEAARLFINIRFDDLSDENKAAASTEISAYEKSLFSRADFPETQMQVAGLAMALRRFSIATKALKTALAMDPQLADAWLTLARIQSALDGPNRARKTLETAARKVPEDAGVLYQLGVLYWSVGNHGRAVAPLEKSLELAGPSPVLLDMLAVSHLSLGNTDTARAYAKILADKFPAHRASAPIGQLLKPHTQR